MVFINFLTIYYKYAPLEKRVLNEGKCIKLTSKETKDGQNTVILPTVFQTIAAGQVRWCALGGVKKTRPVLIIGRDEDYNNKANHVTVLPITRTLKVYPYNMPIVIIPNVQSFINIDTILDTSINNLKELIGVLPYSIYNDILEIVKYKVDSTLPKPECMVKNMEKLNMLHSEAYRHTLVHAQELHDEKPKSNTKLSHDSIITNNAIDSKDSNPNPFTKRSRISKCETRDLLNLVTMYKQCGGTKLSVQYHIPYQTLYSKYISSIKELDKRGVPIPRI